MAVCKVVLDAVGGVVVQGRAGDKGRASAAHEEEYLFALPEPDSEPKVPVLPELKLNMYVMGKIDWLLRVTENEVGGFLVAEGDDPLSITDFALVKQTTSHASFEFDDDGLTDYMVKMFERKLDSWQCAHIYAHTHPVMSAAPSGTDDRVFLDKFCNREVPGCCPPWAGQFIRSRTAENYCRLAFNPENGPSVHIMVPVVIDPSIPFRAHDVEAWEAEYKELVTERTYSSRFAKSSNWGLTGPSSLSRSRSPIGGSPFFVRGEECSNVKDPNPNQDYIPPRDIDRLPQHYRPEDSDYTPSIDDRDDPLAHMSDEELEIRMCESQKDGIIYLDPPDHTGQPRKETSDEVNPEDWNDSL